MTNAEKFKTAKERDRAHKAWCGNRHHEKNFRCDDFGCIDCAFRWLDMDVKEAEEEKIEACPFCGGECRPVKNKDEQYVVGCDCCCYASQDFASSRDAVAAHNRVARAVIKAGKKEEK